MTPAARRVPGVVLRRPGSTRPNGVTSVYGYSQREFARLTRANTLHRVSTGYYQVASDEEIDQPEAPQSETEQTD